MSSGVRREGFSRRHRFRGHDCFRPLLRGARKVPGTFSVVHIGSGATAQSRFGISVGRRTAKSAVDRNRIKRCARELFRRHALKLTPVDVVVTLTSRFELASLDPFARELEELLDRACAAG